MVIVVKLKTEVGREEGGCPSNSLRARLVITHMHGSCTGSQ
jgi:hypothetical protein